MPTVCIRAGTVLFDFGKAYQFIVRSLGISLHEIVNFSHVLVLVEVGAYGMVYNPLHLPKMYVALSPRACVKTGKVVIAEQIEQDAVRQDVFPFHLFSLVVIVSHFLI